MTRRWFDQLLTAMVMCPSTTSFELASVFSCWSMGERDLLAAEEVMLRRFDTILVGVELCRALRNLVRCVVPEKSNAIIGVVTVGFECLPSSCDGLTGPKDHGPMISPMPPRRGRGRTTRRIAEESRASDSDEGNQQVEDVTRQIGEMELVLVRLQRTNPPTFAAAEVVRWPRVG
ncbi:hypothetical protein F511_05412 [Dorcoceras hygrometricum]|uniref:Uncharacterized protein n=1 Tax=Dorcoceras hygrometricum TaxID=472368 RepID=A0A2Z7BIN9_9LAMI|nr:hypothetical protein F511_05412 [Dorcoceras hygrometricum]